MIPTVAILEQWAALIRKAKRNRWSLKKLDRELAQCASR